MFPDGFDWQDYERLYSEKDPAVWAVLFIMRSEDSQEIGGKIGLTRLRDEPWRTMWRSGVLCYGMKGTDTQEHINRLGINARCVVLAIDISGPLDKKMMLAEVERIYDEKASRFGWHALHESPTKAETAMQWARGLACYDLQKSGWSKYKIAQCLAPKWTSKDEIPGEPDSAGRTQVDRALAAVEPMIAGGWRSLSSSTLQKNEKLVV